MHAFRPLVRLVRLVRIALAFATVATGASTHAADLLEIYRMGQGADAVYGSARAAWAATQERIPQGRSGLLPTVSLSASTQYNDREIKGRDTTVPGSHSQFNSNAITLSISQPIYRKQNLVAYEQSLIQVEQADAILAQASQDLILRISQAYFDILLARDNVAFAGAQKAAIAEQLQQAKISFEVGTATITDTHEAQARFDLAVSQEIAAKNDLEVKIRTLEQFIGRATPPLAPLGSTLALVTPQPSVMDKWAEEARQVNLQVRAAEAALLVANKEVERNRGAHHPTLDAFASYSENRTSVGNFGGGGFDTFTKAIGLQLAIPIYQGGLVNSRVREALANEERARSDLENARRTAELAARQTYLGVTNGIAQVRALEAALVSTQSSLDSTRLGREVGVRTQVDVLNAQQQLFSARRDLAQARYTYLLSSLRLKSAVGRLTEEDVAQVNRLLGGK